MGTKFTKEQLVNSKRFIHNRDLLHAVLEDGKEYTTAEVENKIKKYMRGKVI